VLGRRFSEIISSLDLLQAVDQTKHREGNTTDLVIIPRDISWTATNAISTTAAVAVCGRSKRSIAPGGTLQYMVQAFWKLTGHAPVDFEAFHPRMGVKLDVEQQPSVDTDTHRCRAGCLIPKL